MYIPFRATKIMPDNTHCNQKNILCYFADNNNQPNNVLNLPLAIARKMEQSIKVLSKSKMPIQPTQFEFDRQFALGSMTAITMLHLEHMRTYHQQCSTIPKIILKLYCV